jgi:transcriptional regulator NrdR family protein
MRCTNCAAGSTRTYDVRQHEDTFPYTVRIRKCQSCGHQYRSIEVPLDIFERAMEAEDAKD